MDDFSIPHQSPLMQAKGSKKQRARILKGGADEKDAPGTQTQHHAAPLSPRNRPAFAPQISRNRPATAPLSPRKYLAIAPQSSRFRPRRAFCAQIIFLTPAIGRFAFVFTCLSVL
ncbi:MAG: hypothetical protein RR893_08380 [Clostridia bacterium]